VTHEDITITCAGIRNISGTGPFIFKSREEDLLDDNIVDNEVTLVRNENYWGGAPAIEELKIVRYEDASAVKAALLNGSLDMVWGAGVLHAQDIFSLQDNETLPLSVFHTDDIQNTLMVINSGKPPTDDITLRKAIIHAIDKVALLEKELGSITRPVDNVFPLDAPYCDLDLTPRWDYDIEKAILLTCNSNTETGKNQVGLAIGLAVGFLVAVVSLCFAFKAHQSRLKLKKEIETLKQNIAAVEA